MKFYDYKEEGDEIKDEGFLQEADETDNQKELKKELLYEEE